MNKELFYRIIDNKDKKITFKKYMFNPNKDDKRKILSSLKLNKIENLTLDFSECNLYFVENEWFLIEIFKHLMTDTRVIKLNLSNCKLHKLCDPLFYNFILTNLKSLKTSINEFNTTRPQTLNYEQHTFNYINNLKSFIDQIDTDDLNDPNLNTIYNFFKSNKTLQSLNISYNDIKKSSNILKIILYSNNSSLKSLNVICFNSKFDIVQNEILNYTKYLTEILNKNFLQNIKFSYYVVIDDQYDEIKRLLKSIEDNSSLLKVKFYSSMQYLLVIFMKSILKNKNINLLNLNFKRDTNFKISCYVLNYILLNNKTFKSIKLGNDIKVLLYKDSNEYINTLLSSFYYEYYTYTYDTIKNVNFKEDYNKICSELEDNNLNLYDDCIKSNTLKFKSKDSAIIINVKEYINFILNIKLDDCKNDTYRNYYKKLQEQLKHINIIYK